MDDDPDQGHRVVVLVPAQARAEVKQFESALAFGAARGIDDPQSKRGNGTGLLSRPPILTPWVKLRAPSPAREAMNVPVASLPNASMQPSHRLPRHCPGLPMHWVPHGAVSGSCGVEPALNHERGLCGRAESGTLLSFRYDQGIRGRVAACAAACRACQRCRFVSIAFAAWPVGGWCTWHSKCNLLQAKPVPHAEVFSMAVAVVNAHEHTCRELYGSELCGLALTK